jgi:hypothetical protein
MTLELIEHREQGLQRDGIRASRNKVPFSNFRPHSHYTSPSAGHQLVRISETRLSACKHQTDKGHCGSSIKVNAVSSKTKQSGIKPHSRYPSATRFEPEVCI